MIVENSVFQLEGIQYAINFTDLFLTFNMITDISPLEELLRLERLGIKNDTYLKNTEIIKILELKGCQIIRLSLPKSYNNNDSD